MIKRASRPFDQEVDAEQPMFTTAGTGTWENVSVDVLTKQRSRRRGVAWVLVSVILLTLLGRITMTEPVQVITPAPIIFLPSPTTQTTQTVPTSTTTLVAPVEGGMVDSSPALPPATSPLPAEVPQAVVEIGGDAFKPENVPDPQQPSIRIETAGQAAPQPAPPSATALEVNPPEMSLEGLPEPAPELVASPPSLSVLLENIRRWGQQTTAVEIALGYQDERPWWSWVARMLVGYPVSGPYIATVHVTADFGQASRDGERITVPIVGITIMEVKNSDSTSEFDPSKDVIQITDGTGQIAWPSRSELARHGYLGSQGPYTIANLKVMTFSEATVDLRERILQEQEHELIQRFGADSRVGYY